MVRILSVGAALAVAGRAFAAEPIRAALYVDRGCRGNGVIFWAEILHDSPDVEVKFVDGADIRGGALDDRELIVMPGGWGGQQYNAMGDEGAAKLRAFVANGGKYFGTCCGFSMTLNESQPSPKRLRMLPFRRIKGADRGQLAATVSFNRRGAEWLGIRAGDWTIRYSKGPVVEMTEPVPPAKNVEVLATMNCELVQKGPLEGPMYGRPAAVRADYGKGEMLVFNCHPEIYLKSREIVAAGIGALTGRKVRLAPCRPPTPGAERVGYATDDELVSSKKAVEGYFKLRENQSIVVVPVSRGQLDEGFAPLVDRVVKPKEAERAFDSLAGAEPMRVLELPARPNNPRNSEGDFAVLNDGRIVYTYSHYSTAAGGDHAPAHLASRYSSDGGRTWTEKSVTTVANEGGMNVMSVSYQRLGDGALAIFYLRKNSTTDCRPMMRVTRDEGKTWGEPVACVPDADCAYYVLNNCRVARLKSGRLLLPLWQEKGTVGGRELRDLLGCYLSDDEGRTWRRGRFAETLDAQGRHVVVQEPGAVELKDGRVLLYARTDRGRQWFFHSSDGGETFSKGEPGSLFGPLSPATVKRLKSGDLLAVWNDHEFAPELAKAGPSWAHGLRTPLTLAVSKDEGKTWINRRTLEGDPKGWYCYFAVLEKDDELLLGYGAEGVQLNRSRLTRVPLAWLSSTSRER